MAIRVNTQELLLILDATPPSHNILLLGRHGVGKTQILTGYYSKRGLRVVPLFLGQMSDPGDLLGLPHKGQGTTEFLPPSWWPMDNTPVALFLDELNRARPELLQAVHELALGRKLAGRALPKGSVVLAAANQGDDYQVGELDPALVSRFNVYEFAPDAEEWLQWARGVGLDPRVVAFIEAHRVHLDGSGASQGRGGKVEEGAAEPGPDRRAWVRASEMLAPCSELTPLHKKALAGVVGAQAAVAFFRFLSSRRPLAVERLVSLSGEDLSRELAGLSAQEQLALNQEVLQYIEDRIPKLPARERPTIAAAVERYVEVLRMGARGEIVADLISRLEGPRFPRASALLLSSPKLMQALTLYIERLPLNSKAGLRRPVD